MKKALVLVGTLGLLAACGGGVTSVEDLQNDPKLLAETMLECQTGKAEGEICTNATEAVQKAAEKMAADAGITLPVTN